MKKRLLTLALALAAVCAMAVTAMAATPPAGLTWLGGNDPSCTHTSATEGATTAATCITAGSKTWTCDDCGATATETIPATGTHIWDTAWTNDGTNHWHKCTADPNCTAKDSDTAHDFTLYVQEGTAQHKQKCSVCDYVDPTAQDCDTSEHTYDSTHHWTKCSKCGRESTKEAHAAAEAWSVDSTTGTHYKACTNTDCDYKLQAATHTFPTAANTTTKADADNHYAECTVCKQTILTNHEFTYTRKDATQHTKDCKTCSDFDPVVEDHTFDTNGKCTYCNYSNTAAPSTGVITSTDFTMSTGTSETLSVTLKDANGNVTTKRTGITFRSSNNSVASVSSAGVVNGRSAGTAVISLYINGEEMNSVTVTVKRTQNVAITISDNIGVYYFSDQSTNTGYSIFEQIYNSVDLQSNSSLSDYTVIFTNSFGTAGSLGSLNSTTNTLSNLGNVYLTVSSSGTWTSDYLVTLSGVEVLRGTVTITVEPYSGIDILYTASLGENVTLQLSDFQKFWSEETSRYNTLSYVRINSVRGLSGTLCYNHKNNEGYSHTNAIGNYYYASPSSTTQSSLSALTFVPAKYGSSYTAGSVSISFTAYGNNRYNSTESVTGNIVIVFTNGQVQGISYNTSTGYIPLAASDFTSVYKVATASTITNPTFTIQFLEVPAYGSLYYHAYNTGTYNNGVALTKDTVDTYSFTNQSNSIYSINNVTYVPGYYSSLTDSVRYAVYSGNSLLYIGTVTFNAEKIVVSYNSYSNGTYFSAYDFFYGNSALLNSQFISFGTPTSGALYKNYSAGKGTPVTPNDFFSYTTTTSSTGLSEVCFIPNAGYTGVVEIPFYASSLSSTYITGTVKIYVVAKPFSDVENNWSTAYINRLYASGIVSGTSATTFSPKSSMKYGEALKMILQAAGYPKQVEGTGANWAKNYLTFAYQQGIVSSLNINLNEAISRDAMAEIAAKALGLAKANYVNVGIEGPTDSTNGYVYALYNAGIVGGDSSSGVNKYYGSRNINRDEVAKIICNIMDYKD